MSSDTHQVDHYEIGSRPDLIDETDDIENDAMNRYEIGEEGDRIEIGGANDAMNRYEIGADDVGDDCVGAEETAAAVKKVIQTARDGRQPPPKMRAVSLETPLDEAEFVLTDWFADVLVGCSQMIGADNAFPLTTKFMQRFGAGQEKPRIVRVDTEETYAKFRADSSPDMAAMQAHLAELADDLEEHLHDPSAHPELLEAIEEAEMLGAEAKKTEELKAIEMWLPDWAKGKVHAWKEGEFICASIHLPGCDGETRICTSMTPIVRAVEEIELHAANANVSAAAVIGVLPAMGCVLGAGTLVKEMAAAAPSLLAQPAASQKTSFMCRIEPKASPFLCAMTALCQSAANGDQGAIAEWNALSSAAKKGGATPVVSAMAEAKALLSNGKRK